MNPKASATLIVWLAVMGLFALPAISEAQTVDAGVVKLPDAEIEYFTRGEGEAIVLLPGGTLTVAYLDGLAEALAKAGYRVVGINFPGSGKSKAPSKGITLQTFADQVAGVIKDLKIEPVHVAGNDLGNRVARMLAATHPELVRSVILLAAGERYRPNRRRCTLSISCSTRRPPTPRCWQLCRTSFQIPMTLRRFGTL